MTTLGARVGHSKQTGRQAGLTRAQYIDFFFLDLRNGASTWIGSVEGTQACRGSYIHTYIHAYIHTEYRVHAGLQQQRYQ